MSAGAFENHTYETNGGVAYPIRVQPETLALTLGGVANADGSGTIAANTPSVRVSNSRRSLGVTPRKVTVEFTTAPAGYEQGSTITLPVLTEDAWDGYSKGQTGTYLGAAITFVGKSPESIK